MTVDNERIEKIGDLGEALLHTLCLKGGLTATKTSKDKFGWDFFVEFPMNRLPLTNFDAQPPAIKSLVQVKATDNFGNGRISIKVSNWERLAANTLPAFILVVDFNGEDDPSRLYLCHVDTSRVGEVLKRMRELEAANDKCFHKHEMNLIVHSNEEIGRTGTALRSAIVAHAGHDLSDYSDKKSKVLQNIGFEQGRYVLQFGTRLKIDDFANALIGLGDINISEGSVSTFRFGISLHERLLQGGTLKLNPTSNQTCEVSVTSKRPFSRVTFPASVFAPPPDIVDASLRRIRVSTGSILDIILYQEKTTIKFNVDPDQSYRLSEFISSIEFVTTCRKGSKVKITSNQEPIFEVDVENEKTIDSDLIEFLARGKDLRTFLDKIGRREDVTVCLRDLFDPPGAYRWIKATLHTKTKIRTNLENEKVKWKGRGIFASPVQARFNEVDTVAFVYWDANFVVSKGRLSARLSNARCFNTHDVDRLDILKLDSDYQIFENFCREASEGNLMIRSIALTEGDKEED